jgi:Zn-dependent protease with chaperone function
MVRLCVAALWVALGFGLASGLALRLEAQSAGPQKSEPYRLPAEKLEQARVLGRIRPALHFGSELWQIAALALLLGTGGAARLAGWAERRTRREWLRAAVFAVLLASGLFLVVDLPFAAAGHAYSRQYGISVESWAVWAQDEAKMLGLTVTIEAPLLMLVYGLMRWRWSQRRYWAWAALMTIPVMLAGTFLLPPLVEPLFYEFEPLAGSHPALAADLERVAARTGEAIPVDRIFLMKASAKSNGLNAYVSGFGASKRIVVWDTTADRMPEDEILFTFAHEAGHYVLLHIPKGLALASVGVFALFGLTALVAGWLGRRYGGQWGVARMGSLPGLVVVMLALSMMQFVSEPVEAGISRHFEHAADVYGQEAVHGIVADPQQTAVRAFNRLGEAYLDDPEPNAFVVWWSYDHPSIQERARFAAGYDPWGKGGRPRFFR